MKCNQIAVKWITKYKIRFDKISSCESNNTNRNNIVIIYLSNKIQSHKLLICLFFVLLCCFFSVFLFCSVLFYQHFMSSIIESFRCHAFSLRFIFSLLQILMTLFSVYARVCVRTVFLMALIWYAITRAHLPFSMPLQCLYSF